MSEEIIYPLKWEGDVAIGKQGDSYVMYQVFENGELWISGSPLVCVCYANL